MTLSSKYDSYARDAILCVHEDVLKGDIGQIKIVGLYEDVGDETIKNIVVSERETYQTAGANFVMNKR